MGKYCDTVVLERNWFEWIVANATPQLEPFRRARILRTKIIGTVPAPKIPKRRDPELPDPNHPIRLHFVEPRIMVCTEDAKTLWTMPYSGCDLAEFYSERTVDQCWHALLGDIAKMCRGIVCKFNQPTDEAKDNLANEAFVQVASKLTRGRLKYMPGRAPVFNLLTTTIHRCIYSALAKDQRQRRNTVALTDNVLADQSGD